MQSMLARRKENPLSLRISRYQMVSKLYTNISSLWFPSTAKSFTTLLNSGEHLLDLVKKALVLRIYIFTAQVGELFK